MIKKEYAVPTRPWAWTGSLVVAALAWLAMAFAAPGAWAGKAEFSDESMVCVKCHNKPDIADKQMEDGKKLSMHISGKDFLASRHFEQDCTDCHSSIEDDKTHGKVKTPLKNRRELTASMQETCRDCHKKKFKQYEDSIHAALIKDGSEKAPLCANCHNSHTQPNVKIPLAIDKTPCVQCHEKIFNAHVKDVHGLEYVKQGGKKSPTCQGCHQAHEVKAASLGDGQKGACLECHKGALAKHADWLPNAGLHFDTISCVACHAPDAKRRVNLRLYDDVADKQLREKAGVPQFASRVKAEDAANTGLDEGDLRGLLKQFNKDIGPAGKIVIQGRLEVDSGVEAHQLTEKSKALKTCDTCHKQGAQPFQKVVLSIASADGRALRHTVQSNVLGSATAMDSVRGFYALGSTRIKLLDWLLGLAVVASIGGCLAHMSARRATQGLRDRLAAEAGKTSDNNGRAH